MGGFEATFVAELEREDSTVDEEAAKGNSRLANGGNRPDATSDRRGSEPDNV